jgi:hypothetical protein
VRTVLFITDGAVGNDTQLLQLTSKLDPACRITVMGIGRAPSNALLERLARLGGGTCTIVTSDDDIAAELKSLDAELAGPIAFGLHEAGTDPSACRTADLFAGRGGTLFLKGARTRVKLTSADGAFAAECDVTPSPMPLGPLWARAEVERLEDRRISHPAEAKEIDAAIERLGLAHHIQTRMTSFVAVDEQSRVTGEAISLVQPVSRADDARWSVHTPRTVYSRRDTSDAPYYANIAEPASLFIGSEPEPDPLPRDDDSDVVLFLKVTADVKMRLMSGLAEGPDLQDYADLLVALEELLQLVSQPATNRNDPVMAACVLTMMVACMDKGPSRPTLAKALIGFDLSPAGEPWKRWMMTLNQVRNEPAWKLMVPALESGDFQAIAQAADAAAPHLRKSRWRP